MASSHPMRAAVGVAGAAPRWTGAWLLACAALAAAVLVVGGLTRLTHSGLSIVHWQPLAGVVPPLDAGDWNALFAAYQGTPEYRQLNAGMSLAQFQSIFWWEYAHRLLARVAGLAYVLPCLLLLAQRRVAGALAWRMSLALLLGFAQGIAGWWMVASGLVDEPRVAPLRLALHLGLALALIGLLLWSAWSLAAPPAPCPPVSDRPPTRPGRRTLALAGAVTVYLMALSGALVAGSHSGLVYNTFPLMDGAWIPAGLLALSPWTENLTYNPATIQFLHRLLAVLVIVVQGALVIQLTREAARHAGIGRRITLARAGLLAAVLLLQVGLGIATLLSVVALPLAALHQAGALLLFVTVLRIAHTRAAPAVQGT